MAEDSNSIVKLFGFEIRRRNKASDGKKAPSIVPPVDDDGAGYVTASGTHMGAYLNMEDDYAKDNHQMIQKYRERYPVSGEINLKVNNIKTIIDSIKEYYLDDALGVDETDGVGMEFEKWRFNLRASNTEPLIRLNVESYNNESLMNEKTRELVDRINSLD